jgi:putative inorganic carbon (HCO3(-)) transporter
MPKKKESKLLEVIKRYDRYSYITFLFLLVAVPLAVSRITFDQFDMIKMPLLRVLTFIALGFWVLKILQARRAKIRWSWFDLGIIIFLTIILLATIFSIHLPTALHGKYKRYEGLLSFINYAMLYFLALQLIYNERRTKRVAQIFALAGALVSFYGLLQYFGLDPLKWATLPFEERRSFSTFGNPDLLGGYLALALPITLSTFYASEDQRETWLFGISSFLIVVCLLTTFTRGAWVGGFAGALAFLILNMRGIIKNPRRLAIVIGSFLAIFIILSVYSSTAGNNVLNLLARLKSTVNLSQGSVATRLEIWKAGLKAIQDRPLLGSGPDTFRLISEKYETLRYVKLNSGRTVADNAHNYWIQLGVGGGILAVVVFVLLFFVFSRIALRGLKEKKGSDRLILGGLFASAIAYFIHLLFGVSVTGSTALFWIILGVVISRVGTIKSLEFDRKETYGLINLVSILIVLLITFISAYYAVSMYVADYYSAEATRSVSRGEVYKGIKNLRQAISLYKNGRYYDTLGNLLQKIAIQNKDIERLNKAIEVYETAKRLEPHEADHRIFLASALLQVRDRKKLNRARGELEKVLKEIRPLSVPAHFLLGSVYEFMGKHKKAISMLKWAININPKQYYAHFMLGKSYESLGMLQKAQWHYDKAYSLKPSFAEAASASRRIKSKLGS